MTNNDTENVEREAEYPSIKYNKSTIDYTSIDAFKVSSKNKNDGNNKMRENIIGAIINNKIPEKYFTSNRKWKNLKKAILKYLKLQNNKKIDIIKCEHKGGRQFNFDFLITITYDDKSIEIYNIEFKFNANKIDDAPQFVSPMKPSQYLTKSYEEYYYDNHLQKIADSANLPIPDKEEYLSKIHNNKPKCMKKFQEKYYKGCKKSSKFTNNQKDIDFYNFCKEKSKQSISQFIEKTDLNKELLSTYLQESQNNKIYMLYYNKKITSQCVNMDDYQIQTVTKNPKLNRYDCITKSGKKMKVLLRWKNGNSIAFPSLQIS